MSGVGFSLLFQDTSKHNRRPNTGSRRQIQALARVSGGVDKMYLVWLNGSLITGEVNEITSRQREVRRSINRLVS